MFLVADPDHCGIEISWGIAPRFTKHSYLTYLRLGRKQIGLVINFNVPLLKDGIKRRVLNLKE